MKETIHISPSRRIVQRLVDTRGTALVELGIVLPLVMLLLLGMVDFGRAFNEWIDETHLASSAARLAAVNYCPDTASSWAVGGDCGWASKGCPITPATQDGCLAWYVAQNADVAELKKRTSTCPTPPSGQPPLPGRCTTSGSHGQNAANICITYPSGTANPGDPVRVVVKIKYYYLNYLASRIGLISQSLVGQATMRLESPPPAGVSASSSCVASNQYPGGAAGT